MAARFLTTLAAALLLIGPNAWAQSQSADPPGRVGRLSAVEGAVQQRTPDDSDWVQANLNYPVTTGFAIAPQDDGRAEIQVGSMALRIGPSSELDVADLSDRDASLTLAQGELSLRVGEVPRGVRIEVVTPRGVMQILAAGEYHLDAGTTDSPTRFEVFDGRAQVQRDAGNNDLRAGQAALINPDDSVSMASAEPDPLDQWAFDRDRGPGAGTKTANGQAPPPPAPATAPYVSPEMTGEGDLSAYGSWAPSPDYGQVWYPSGVPAGWAPYTDGHWAWVSPWGWTWIDDEPWGFAPFHYGRWAYIDDRWGWIPGDVSVAPVYAPALVVFIGGSDHRFFFDRDREGVGWFPLGPHEAFVPGYRTSIDYVRNVNRTNVDVRNLNITRVNNTFVINNQRGATVNSFANHRFATVVPANQFGQTRRARDVAVRTASVTTAAASLPVSHAPAVTAPHTTPATNRGTQFNRASRPSLPQARTAIGVPSGRPGAPGSNAPSRTISGHTLPALPPAQSNATKAANPPSRFGGSARPQSATTNRGLPRVPTGPATGPSVNGNHAPQGAAINNAAPTGRSARGPFGTTRLNAPPNATAPGTTSSSAGHALRQPPLAREPMAHPPAAQSHAAQPTTTTNAFPGHRGLAAPATPGVPRNTAAPTRNFAPPQHPPARAQTTAPAHTFVPPTHNVAPPRPQTPARSFTPQARSALAPHVAAPVHSAPPAAPARPVGNAAVSHAPAPHAQPAPRPTNNNKKNQN